MSSWKASSMIISKTFSLPGQLTLCTICTSTVGDERMEAQGSPQYICKGYYMPGQLPWCLPAAYGQQQKTSCML
jgi:hypothetical protein